MVQATKQKFGAVLFGKKISVGIEKRVSRHDMAIIRLDVLREVKARIEREIRAIKTKHKI